MKCLIFARFSDYHFNIPVMGPQHIKAIEWNSAFVTLSLIVDGATEKVSQCRRSQFTTKTFVLMDISTFLNTAEMLEQ
jgi:hypothetical protein